MRGVVFSSAGRYLTTCARATIIIISLLFLCHINAQQKVEDIANPEQHYLYAAGLMQRNFYDLALPQLKIFLHRYPEHEHAKEAQRLLIHCTHALNQQAETLEEITQFRRRWPKDPLNEQFLLMESVIRYKQEDFAGALATYKSLSGSENQLTAETGLYFQGQCYLRLKQDDDAFNVLKKLAEKPLSGEFPYRAYAAFHVAGEWVKRENNQAARELYKKISSSRGLNDEMREKALLRVADLEYEAKNFVAALAAYEEYILSFPEGDFRQLVYRQRLVCAYHLQDYAKVAELGGEFQSKYPQALDFELEMALAESLMELKRYEEAIVLYEKLGQDRKTPEQYRFAAMLQELTCLSLLERQLEILQKGQKLLAEFPNCPDKGRILFQVGKAAQTLKKQAEAEKFLRAAMEFFVGENELFLTAADALARSLQVGEKWAEAAMVSRRVSEKAPAALQAAYRLQAAQFEFKQENFAEVQQEIDLIRRRWPDQKEILIDALQLQVNASLALNEYEVARANLVLLEELMEPKDCGTIGLLLADVLLRLKRDDEAAAVVKKTMSLPELEPSLLVKLQVMLLRLHFEQAQDEAALPLLEQILLLPEKEQKECVPASLWYAGGELFNRLQRYDEAEKALRLCLADDEQNLRTQGGLLLAEILVLHNRNEEADALLAGIRRDAQQAGQKLSPELASLLAELNMQLKRHAQAFAAVEQCFDSKDSGSLRALTRARWVMAKLLFEVESDAKNALPYSIKCFVLADDPVYSPKAMQLAIAIYCAMDNENDARTTWNELKQRYPVWAAGMQNTEPMKNWQ